MVLRTRFGDLKDFTNNEIVVFSNENVLIVTISADLILSTPVCNLEFHAEDLPLDDGSVDRVLSSLMLHHIAADAQVAALREAHRVLAPGGSLHLVDLDHDPRSGGRMRTVNRVLSLLARLDPAHRRSRRGAHRDHGDHGHGHGHGAQPVPELLAAAGFTDATVVGHGTTRMGPVTYYRAER